MSVAISMPLRGPYGFYQEGVSCLRCCQKWERLRDIEWCHRLRTTRDRCTHAPVWAMVKSESGRLSADARSPRGNMAAMNGVEERDELEICAYGSETLGNSNICF